MCWSPGMPNLRGIAPVAITTWRPSNTSSPISTAVESTKYARPVKGHNTCFGKAPFATFRHRIRERSLEAHQFRPFDSSVLSAHASSVHPLNPIDHFRCAHQHLLGITSAQGTGSSERPGFDNGDIPTSGTAPLSDGRSGRTGADHDEIEF